MNEIFQKMLEELLVRWKDYDTQGTPTWTREIVIRDLIYQVGSLSKLMLQEEHSRYREGLDDAQIQQKIGDELVDILGEVLFLAKEYNINLSQTWNEMLESDRRKILERT